MTNKWIQKSHLEKGALHRQLQIPKHQLIPDSLLMQIHHKQVGDLVNLPQKDNEIFVRRVRLTKLLKERSNLALTLRKLHKRRS